MPALPLPVCLKTIHEQLNLQRIMPVTIIEYAPLLNLGLIAGGGILFITRISDVLKHVMKSNETIATTVAGIDKRVTIVETVCALNHSEQRLYRSEHRDKEGDK